MSVTTTEFRKNLAYYIKKSQKEDVLIESNHVIVAKLVSPTKNKAAVLDSLVGILPGNTDEKTARVKRIAR